MKLLCSLRVPAALFSPLFIYYSFTFFLGMDERLTENPSFQFMSCCIA